MKTHPLIKDLNVFILQCVAATFCIMMIQSCMPTQKIKPATVSFNRILQDSLNKAAMDADIKASKEKFKMEREAKAKRVKND